jgi:uncharacterized protein (TIGR02301 family)
MRALLLLTAALALAGPAAAQPTRPDLLVQLARVIGESHALRQVCEGRQDQYWRERMFGLLDAEAPDDALRDRLSRAFNSGYIGGQLEFARCSAASREAETRAAAQGRDVAARLGQPAPAR